MDRKLPARSKRPSRSRQAIARHKRAALTPSEPSRPEPFKPTAAMETFAVRYVEAIADGPFPVRLGDIAEKAGVTSQTVSEWRHQTSGFNEWLAVILASYVAHTWPAIKAVAVRFAMRGSIEHMKFLRELIEPAPKGPSSPSPNGAGTSIFAGAVIVNLPQPPAELAGHPLVRGLFDQAQTFEATARPAP